MTDDHREIVDPDTMPACERCGEQHKRREVRNGVEIWYRTCNGHRRNGLPCKKYDTGAGVCALHGGSAPQVKAAVSERKERRRIEDQIRKTMASEMVRVNPDTLRTDPVQGLMWEVAMSAQTVEWLALQIADLSVPRPNDDAGPMRDVIGVDAEGNEVRAQPSGRLWGPTRAGELGVHVLYNMWSDERERHARMCERAIKAGVAERMVAIAEAQGIQIVSVIAHVIDIMDVPAAEKVRARTVAAQKLRELGPGGIAAIEATATG